MAESAESNAKETVMATIDQTMMKVQRILTGPMGLRISLSGDVITSTFSDTSTSINIRVLDWGKSKDGEPRTLVRVFATVLRGVRPTPELYEYIVRQAPTRWFGHISVYDEPNAPGEVYVSFGHTLLGDYLDEEELAAAVWNVLGGADEMDDPMQQRFGGKRWVDA
jgi:hypothetical protein